MCQTVNELFVGERWLHIMSWDALVKKILESLECHEAAVEAEHWSQWSSAMACWGMKANSSSQSMVNLFWNRGNMLFLSLLSSLVINLFYNTQSGWQGSHDRIMSSEQIIQVLDKTTVKSGSPDFLLSLPLSWNLYSLILLCSWNEV